MRYKVMVESVLGELVKEAVFGTLEQAEWAAKAMATGRLMASVIDTERSKVLRTVRGYWL